MNIYARFARSLTLRIYRGHRIKDTVWQSIEHMDEYVAYEIVLAVHEAADRLRVTLLENIFVGDACIVVSSTIVKFDRRGHTTAP